MRSGPSGLADLQFEHTLRQRPGRRNLVSRIGLGWGRYPHEAEEVHHMIDENPNAPARRPYSPPRITEIPLRPEESVLSLCKAGDNGAITGSSCSACYTLGS